MQFSFHVVPHLAIGCGDCWVLDGNRKLAFAHCMFAVECTVEKLKLSYPNVCPEEPKGAMAFCAKHCLVAEERGIPTKLQDFLKFCGLEGEIHVKYVMDASCQWSVLDVCSDYSYFTENVAATEDPSRHVSSSDDQMLSVALLKSAVDVDEGVPSSAHSQGTI